jgi:hypothetical protein
MLHAFRDIRHFGEQNGVGLAVSLILHGSLLCLVLFGIAQRIAPPHPYREVLVPIDLVRLGEETRSPPAETKALPQQKAGAAQSAAAPEEKRMSLTGRKPVAEDALDSKLKALARLKQVGPKVKLDAGQSVSNIDAANGATGDSASYSIRDYVLAQVLRRWAVDLEKTKNRPLIISIKVTMKRDGSITEATLLELGRAKTDSYYRDIATGARNAVLLSSPISLPPGDYPKEMHFTLNLDTRAVLR